MDAVLGHRYGDEVVRIVRAMEAEHRALDTDHPIVTIDDLPVLLARTVNPAVCSAVATAGVSNVRRSLVLDSRGNPTVDIVASKLDGC